jgi:hypothetical protein
MQLDIQGDVMIVCGLQWTERESSEDGEGIDISRVSRGAKVGLRPKTIKDEFGEDSYHFFLRYEEI